MASDVERSYWASTADEPGARLCNFATGGSTLLPAHQQWLMRNVVPLLRGSNTYIVEVGGLASRLGAAAVNDRLGQARADATKAFLEQQLLKSLPYVLTASYGESVSGGGVNDDDGYYRAVLIKLHKGAVVLPDPPPPVKRPPTMPKAVPKLYFGFGVKGGLMLVGGMQKIEGYLYSADEYHDQAVIEARILTLGPGVGGGANVVFIMAHGTPHKHEFIGVEFTGWDFAVAVGTRWGQLGKLVAKLPTVLKLAQALKKSGKLDVALKAASKLSASEWEKVADLVKTSRGALGVDLDATTPQLHAFDVPLLGVALELSVYKWWGTVISFR